MHRVTQFICASASVAMCSAVGRSQAPASSPASTTVTETTAAYRARWLGVYEQLTGEPLGGVRVIDMASGNSAETSLLGAVNLIYLAEGVNLVTLQKVGYEPVKMAIAISPKDTLPLSVLMKRVSQLPKVVTTGKAESPHLSGFLRDFDERRKNAATGYFITDSIIRRDEAMTLGDLLRVRAPNVIIQRDGGVAEKLMQARSCTRGEGPPQVYLDGVALSPPPTFSRRGAASTDATPFDLSQFNLLEIGAIEWYPENSRLPIEFAHTSPRCGALLLWTRER